MGDGQDYPNPGPEGPGAVDLPCQAPDTVLHGSSPARKPLEDSYIGLCQPAR